jgi:hypothetical protein
VDRLTQRVGMKDIPVLRFFQESSIDASASLLTLRSLGSQRLFEKFKLP